MEYTERHEGKAVIRDKEFLPGAMEKLARLEELEEQGKLLKLPCAVGDTIYHVCIPRNGEPQIIEMKVGCVEPYGAIRNRRGTREVWNVYAESYYYTKDYFKFFDFGKTVFLTLKEAKVTLENMGYSINITGRRGKIRIVQRGTEKV